MTAGDAIINILRDKKCYATLETSRNGTTVIQTMGWSNVLNEIGLSTNNGNITRLPITSEIFTRVGWTLGTFI